MPTIKPVVSCALKLWRPRDLLQEQIGTQHYPSFRRFSFTKESDSNTVWLGSWASEIPTVGEKKQAQWSDIYQF